MQTAIDILFDNQIYYSGTPLAELDPVHFHPHFLVFIVTP